MKAERVLAIDPGREKCGVAVVDRQRGVLWQAVVERSQLIPFVETAIREYACRTIILGDGTTASQTQTELALLLTDRRIDQIVAVDERDSTREARLRYWVAHPPSGWRKVIPVGLLTPPCAIDDFAAIVLAERYFFSSAPFK